MDILDNLSVVEQRDPDKAYQVVASEWQQVSQDFTIESPREATAVANVVVAGMGGSALAADLAKDWLELKVPYEVVKHYDVPAYVDETTLFIANSFSGNTEEVLASAEKALAQRAQVVVIAKGGKLEAFAHEHQLPYITLNWDYQPRMGMFMHLRALVTALVHYGVAESAVLDEMAATLTALEAASQKFLQSVPTEQNPAKQLALWCAGKTPLICADYRMKSLAYKWKISFNENSKNVAFCNEVPEFDHNEFTGWTSHPVEKPFAIIDLHSTFNHPRVEKRFDLGEKLLSGRRPAPKRIQLEGDTVISQLLWGCILADFVSVYLGILNGVNPMRVDLIEKLKVELG